MKQIPPFGPSLWRWELTPKTRSGTSPEQEKTLPNWPKTRNMDNWKSLTQKLVDWLDELDVDATIHSASHDKGNLGANVKNLLWLVGWNMYFWIQSKILLHQTKRLTTANLLQWTHCHFQETNHRTLSQARIVNNMVQLCLAMVRLRVHIFLSVLDPVLVICTTNGNTSPITGEWSITLTDSLTLDIVLIVSSLEYNLLLVSQINMTLACIVTF